MPDFMSCIIGIIDVMRWLVSLVYTMTGWVGPHDWLVFNKTMLTMSLKLLPAQGNNVIIT